MKLKLCPVYQTGLVVDSSNNNIAYAAVRGVEIIVHPDSDPNIFNSVNDVMYLELYLTPGEHLITVSDDMTTVRIEPR